MSYNQYYPPNSKVWLSPGNREHAGLDGWHADLSWKAVAGCMAHGSEPGSWGPAGRDGWHADRSWGPAGRMGHADWSWGHAQAHGAFGSELGVRGRGTREWHADRRPDTETVERGNLDESAGARAESAGPRHREGGRRAATQRALSPDTESAGPRHDSAGGRHRQRRGRTQNPSAFFFLLKKERRPKLAVALSRVAQAVMLHSRS